MNRTHSLIGLACWLVLTCFSVHESLGGEEGVVGSLSSSTYFLEDEDAAKQEEVASTPPPCTSCCKGSCRSNCRSCEATAPWTLPQPCLLQNFGIRVGGWLEQGVTLNPYNSNDGFNGPVATNDWDDRYQMNQLWMYLDRPADTGGCGTAVGGHLDVIYGSDWRFGVNEGLETRLNGFDEPALWNCDSAGVP